MAAAEVSRGTGARHVHHHSHCENNCRNFTPDESSGGGGGGGGGSGARTHYHHHPHHPPDKSDNRHNDNYTNFGSVGQRLYSQGHICNHARCAANDPHYNVKAATPPKKFLVAKSKNNTYGGLEDRTGRGGARTKKSSGSGSGGDGSSCTSSDHDHQSHALHSLTNSVLLENSNNKGNGGRGRGRREREAGTGAGAGAGPKPKPELPFSKGRTVEADRKLTALAHSVLQRSLLATQEDNSSRGLAGRRKSLRLPMPTTTTNRTNNTYASEAAGRPVEQKARSVAAVSSSPANTAQHSSRSGSGSVSSRISGVTESSRSSSQRPGLRRPEQQQQKSRVIGVATGNGTAGLAAGPAAGSKLTGAGGAAGAAAAAAQQGKTTTRGRREIHSPPLQQHSSPSPKSSITSISFTQIISSTRGGGEEEELEDEEDEEGAASASACLSPASAAAATAAAYCLPPSPTASVGSNHDAEEDIVSTLKKTIVIVEEDGGNSDPDLYPSTPPPSPSHHGDGMAAVGDLDSHSIFKNKKIHTPGSSDTTSSHWKTSSLPEISDGSEGSSRSQQPPLAAPAAAITLGDEQTSSSPRATSADSLELLTSELTSRGILGSEAYEATTPGMSSTSKNLSTGEDPAGKSPLSSISSAASPANSKKSTGASPSGHTSPSPSSSTGTGTGTSTSTSSQLGSRVMTDLHAKKPGSSKGVRAIELRGGRAQSFSRTTVTSWNLTTTTTVEETSAAADASEKTHVNNNNNYSNSNANHNLLGRSSSNANTNNTTRAKGFLARSGSTPTSRSKPLWNTTNSSSSSSAATNITTASGSTTKENAKQQHGKEGGARTGAGAGNGMTYTRRARSTTVFDRLLLQAAESERVALKHGEVAERRLSEEWMTNHALEGVVKNIADKDHRVKLLVHAFETLATALPDAVGGDEEEEQDDGEDLSGTNANKGGHLKTQKHHQQQKRKPEYEGLASANPTATAV